ncbi:MAG: extracellular solute-binding protein [Spirochaetaceae bacterium]|jgi:microcin C transport system substrate-binding protein|nr:extracellular solute-binding protein [Spirochaetaceae bacterium]
MKRLVCFILSLLALCVPLCFAQSRPALISATYLSLRDEPLYKAGFTHFNYVNPDAPKGGRLTLAAMGTYDNFHRYALRGSSPAGYQYFYDSLMIPSDDDVDVLYPLAASRVEYASDYSYFIFEMNPRVQDYEGYPVTADDVEFTFTTIMSNGVPQFRAYYDGVTVHALDKSHVRDDMPPELDGEDNPQRDANGNVIYSIEKMMGLATLPVFPKRFWGERNFSEPLLVPPVGTGPYRVKEYKMGQSLTFERVKNYWAADLPVNKGRYNFDIIHYDYYRDANVVFEAFKAGDFDFREENSAKNWATQYTGNWMETQHIVCEEIPNQIAQTTAALVFNIQRPVFSDRRVRMALNYFFDFQWMNKNFFYDSYTRTRSYFQNTVYEAQGLPSPDELAVLEPIKNLVPSEVFTTEYDPPVTDGTGNIRPGAREALRILKEAGWELKDGKLIDRNGKQMSFELLIYDVAIERIALAFSRNLERYGIDAHIRTVDDSQFINRLRVRDFDMISRAYPAFQTPSSDLQIVWHSKHIDSTWNTVGVSDPAIDYLTTQIAANQQNGEKLLTLGHAFDRVLTWNYYIIPEWHLPSFRIAHKDKFGKPDASPKYDIGLDTWWIK